MKLHPSISASEWEDQSEKDDKEMQEHFIKMENGIQEVKSQDLDFSKKYSQPTKAKKKRPKKYT